MSDNYDKLKLPILGNKEYLISKHVRLACENFVASPYNKDKRFGKNLTCMCAFASHHLTEVLKANNLKARLMTNSGSLAEITHCWVEISDVIIDITATQFEDYYDPILVVKKESEYDFHEYGHVVIDPFKAFKRWGTQFNPLRYHYVFKKYYLSMYFNKELKLLTHL